MSPRLFKITSLLIIGILLLASSAHAQESDKDKHIEVSLRMIGHQILLKSKDSTSRVLPILKDSNRFGIQFASDFEFVPDDLVSTIDSVVKQTDLAKSYIVEVEQCDTEAMVYSFKVEHTEKSDIIPCQQRVQPKACYILYITILDSKWLDPTTNTSNSDTMNVEENGPNQLMYIVISGLLLLIGVLSYLVWRRRQRSVDNSNLIPLGAYHFDKLNTELLIEHQRIDLTSKEGDLLLLLYNEMNTTVEREVILNMVWGDEGDYVGRTLDVFISKLRKKLEFDSKVKIVNIRGVGYKLIVDS